MWFYFLLFFVLLLFCFKLKAEDKLVYYFLIGFFLILIAGLRSENICRDYSEYRRYYEGIKSTGNFFLVEPTFVLITLITPNIEWLMMIYAVLGVSIILVGIKRLTEFYFISLLIYFSGSFILHEMTQIRVGVAAGLLLLCIGPLYDRNFFKFLIIAIIAATFHYSALIILPLYFLQTNKLNLALYSAIIPICYLLHALGIHFSSLLLLFPAGETIQQKLLIQTQAWSGTGKSFQINVFNIIQLLRIILVYVFLWKAELLQKSNKYFTVLLKINILSIASFVIFADVPVFSFRISELLGIVEIILVPMIFYILRPKIFTFALCTVFAFGTLYMLIIYGGLLKPYFG